MAAVRLKEKYQKEVIPIMQERFGYKNIMSVPRIEKVVLNIGMGKMLSGKGSDEAKKFQEFILQELALISGQRPILTRARKSIAGFKIRKGATVGAKVTLRSKRMYDFLGRLIHTSLPRSRDFRGIKKESVDKKGQLTIGIKEHIIFPEIFPEKAKQIFSFEITIVTTAKKEEEAIELFRLLGFPLKV